MYKQVEKTQENKSLSLANAASNSKKSNEPTFQFVDNRPKAVAQRKLQKIANNSPQVQKAAQLQDVANKSQQLTQFMFKGMFNRLQTAVGSDPNTGRQKALDATSKFPHQTVGYGVHEAIGVISLAGGLGEAQIGEVFSSPEAQEIMSRPNTLENNLAIAKVELAYWESVRQNPQSTGERMGAYAGTRFSEKMRAEMQMGFAKNRAATEGK